MDDNGSESTWCKKKNLNLKERRVLKGSNPEKRRRRQGGCEEVQIIGLNVNCGVTERRQKDQKGHERHNYKRAITRNIKCGTPRVKGGWFHSTKAQSVRKTKAKEKENEASFLWQKLDGRN